MNVWSYIKNRSSLLLRSFPLTWIERTRNVYILRRTRPQRLNKMGALFPKKLKRQQYYYEMIENTNFSKSPMLEIVLVKDVPGVGMMGEKLEINCYHAYREFILPKIAIYADSPEAKKITRTKDEVQLSSIYSRLVGNHLLQQYLPIALNGENNWTLEPWHVKMALRQMGVMCSESCIILPEKKISGPDPDIEDKDFIVKVKMNNTEIFPVRCRIRMYLRENQEKVTVDDGLSSKSNPLFPEDEEEINALIKTQKELIENLKVTSMFIRSK